MTFKAYTDYTILGDRDHSIRQVDVVAYDRDKYARIVFNGEYYEVKSGYIFADDQLKLRFSKYAWYSLPTEIDGKYPTRKEVHDTVKKEYRRRKTLYEVDFYPEGIDACLPRKAVKRFSNLADALRYMSWAKDSGEEGAAYLYRSIYRGHNYSGSQILVAGGGYGTRYDSRGYPPVLTTRTLKPYGLH